MLILVSDDDIGCDTGDDTDDSNVVHHEVLSNCCRTQKYTCMLTMICSHFGSGVLV